MKKFLLSLGVIVSSVGYVLYQYFSSGSVAAQAPTPIAQSTSSAVANNQGTSLPQQTTLNTSLPPTTQSNQSSQSNQTTQSSAPAPVPKPKGQYTDGMYSGSQADAYYGTVQVKATVSGGKLTNVAFLQYPNSHGTSVYINQQAMPYLTQEAIQAQSANVDIISGATFTSQAFQQSLADALNQAKS